VNLLSNAFKYTSPGGAISIKVIDELGEPPLTYHSEFKIRNEAVHPDKLWIQVSDTGSGIHAQDLHLIFDRFYQVGEGEQHGKMGSGVGLALVKSLVLLHKGDLYVSSQEGKGTEFLIGLPRTNVYEAETITLPTESQQQWNIADPILPLKHPRLLETDFLNNGNAHCDQTILIVEDNPELRLFIKESFGSQYHVLEAENGQIAWEMIQENKPDLIISDIMMPIMDGIELSKKIKRSAKHKHIPLILLTAKTSIQSQIEGMNEGADVYLPKPFSIEVLQLQVRNMINSQSEKKERNLQTAFEEAYEIAVNEKDRAFMESFVEIIDEQIDNTDFDIDTLCKMMGMSRTKLYNRVKEATGKSVGEFIRSKRLKKAAQILASENVTVSQAMYRVGIQSQSYFTKSFKKEFGKTPMQFVNALSNRSK
ncbi:MAG: response regulator, partial [Bacteroidota bacterium]